MPLRQLRLAPIVALLLATGLAGCANLGLVHSRTEGYELTQDQLAQIREGQSKQLVTMVLGSPQTTNNFGDEEAWYYVETKVSETEFGLTRIKDRTVLAIYFGKNGKIVDRAIYGKEAGRVVAIESRRTPSYGQDRTFLQSIMDSI